MSFKSKFMTYAVAAITLGGGTIACKDTLSKNTSFKTDAEKRENETPGMNAILSMLDAANLTTLDQRKLSPQTAVSVDVPEGWVSEWKDAIDSDLQTHGSERTFDGFTQIQKSTTDGNQRVKFNVNKMLETAADLGGSVNLQGHVSEHLEVTQRVKAGTLPGYDVAP